MKANTSTNNTNKPEQLEIETIYNELAEMKTKRKNNTKWRSLFSPRLCKIIIIVFLFMETARAYGTFTDGLPMLFNYENVLDTFYLFFTQLRTVFGCAWFGLELFSLSLNQLACLLQKNTAFCLLLLMLIIHYLAQVGIYHSSL